MIDKIKEFICQLLWYAECDMVFQFDMHINIKLFAFCTIDALSSRFDHFKLKYILKFFSYNPRTIIFNWDAYSKKY